MNSDTPISGDLAQGRWYLFLHQVPPQPQYFRARVLRQLTQLGAVPIKKSAYVIPANDETLEDLQWLRQSIVTDGGDAWIFRADAVSGHTDDSLQEAFQAARGSDYAALAADARALLEDIRARGTRNEEETQADETRLRKLVRRYEAIERIDFYGSREREEVLTIMREIESLQKIHKGTASAERPAEAEFHCRRWVTRKGIKVDRIASAWLIRRFIDPSPEFIFVDPGAYRHAPRDLRFDMFDGEFTHEGAKCTFEVLLARFNLNDEGLAAIAQIVHDIDLKEAVYQRSETAGVATIIEGIARKHDTDPARLESGAALFDSLYETFSP